MLLSPACSSESRAVPHSTCTPRGTQVLEHSSPPPAVLAPPRHLQLCFLCPLARDTPSSRDPIHPSAPTPVQPLLLKPQHSPATSPPSSSAPSKPPPSWAPAGRELVPAVPPQQHRIPASLAWPRLQAPQRSAPRHCFRAQRGHAACRGLSSSPSCSWQESPAHS